MSVYRITKISYSNFVHVNDLYKSITLQETKRKAVTGEVTGISSCFQSLDNLTGGWQDSEFIVFAGRPAMGKTSLAVSMITNIAVKQGIPAAFFSLEQDAKGLMSRLCSALCDINAQKIKKGKFNEKERKRYDDCLAELLKAPLYIDDTPFLSIGQLREQANILVHSYGVRIIMIDYLQLMDTSGNPYGTCPHYDSRKEEISIITRSLKGLAKELDIPIIAFSQLNRSGMACKENDTDWAIGKHPQLKDFEEWYSIVQDADVICFIHRPEYYNILYDAHGNSTKGVAEITIAKHRNSVEGKTELKFIEKYAKFEERETKEGAQYNRRVGKENSKRVKNYE